MEADIKGLHQPKTLGGYRLDIIAKKGIERKISEVETPDSLNSATDIKQQQAFQRAANRSQKTTFTKRIAK